MCKKNCDLARRGKQRSTGSEARHGLKIEVHALIVDVFVEFINEYQACI